MRKILSKALGLSLAALMVVGTTAFAASVEPVYDGNDLSALTITGIAGNDVTVLAVPARTELSDASLADKVAYIDQFTLNENTASVSDIVSKLRLPDGTTALDIYVGETGVTTAGSTTNVLLTKGTEPDPGSQPSTGVGVKGTVLNAEGAYYGEGAAFGAVVFAIDENWETAGVAVADKDGKFSMDLSAGAYDLIVSYNPALPMGGEVLYVDYFAPYTTSVEVTDSMEDAGTITLKPTFFGDVNGDRFIDGNDLNELTANWYNDAYQD